MRDFYDVLGVGPDATVERIRQMYQKLARKYHADMNSDDPDLQRWCHEMMVELNQAYEILRDPERRARYDSQRQHSRSDESVAQWNTPPQRPSVLTYVQSSWLRLFEAGDVAPPYRMRKYGAHFPKSLSRYIWWELNLTHEAPGQRIPFDVDVIYFHEEDVFSKNTIASHLDPLWTWSYHNSAWGWRDAGNWSLGYYDVLAYVEDQVIAASVFKII